MRLKTFLPLILLAVLLTSCQTDFLGDEMPATNNKSLKIKDAKAFFEEHRPTVTRTEGNTMTLGVTERCSPDWSQAVESENEHLYCVEVPLISGFKFVSTRKRKLGGEDIYLHQDVLRKLIVLKNKQTNKMNMYVMSLVPKVYFAKGETTTSYDFNHFGDKCGYSGLVIYTNSVGSLISTDFYLDGERILHHYLSKNNPRMDIARKIIGPVEIRAFNMITRIGADGFWWCTTCETYHHKDDDIIECAPVIIGKDICVNCLKEAPYCDCGPDETCPDCGQDPCGCYYDSCPSCGQNVNYCICSSSGCPDCGDPYCTTDHQAENVEAEQDAVDAGRNCISCSDANINTILNNFMNTSLGRMVYSKITLPAEVRLNQSHEGAMLVYTSGNNCYISIGNENLSADILIALWEELIHLAQFCEYGFDIMTSAKLNFEFEAKIMILLDICDSNGMYNQHAGEDFHSAFHKLSLHYYYSGYEEYGDQQFEEVYQKSIDIIRRTISDYADEEQYPENPNFRHFNTFHEEYQNSK